MQECINILNNILKNLSRNDFGDVENDIKEIMFSLLRTIIQSIVIMTPDNPLRGNLVAIMLGIFYHMTKNHYSIYMHRNLRTQTDKKDFLMEILTLFSKLVVVPV